MSNSKNSFELNLSTETALTAYTATFSNVDNIAVTSQTLRYGSIGAFKVLFGVINVTFQQDNQALGSHTISLPDDLFSTVYSAQLTISQNDSYLISAHGGDVALDSLEVFYNQGQQPGQANTTGRLNILVIGF